MTTISAIVERDGPDCTWCGRFVPKFERTREHIVPVSAGGRADADNLLLACTTCNQARASTPADIWRAAVQRAVDDRSTHPAILARKRLRDEGLWVNDQGLRPKARKQAAVPKVKKHKVPVADMKADAHSVRMAQSPEIAEAQARIAAYAGRPPRKRTMARVTWEARQAEAQTAVNKMNEANAARPAKHYLVKRSIGGRFYSECGECRMPWPCETAASKGVF